MPKATGAILRPSPARASARSLLTTLAKGGPSPTSWRGLAREAPSLAAGFARLSVNWMGNCYTMTYRRREGGQIGYFVDGNQGTGTLD